MINDMKKRRRKRKRKEREEREEKERDIMERTLLLFVFSFLCTSSLHITFLHTSSI